MLLVDDDQDLIDWLGYSFRKEGYSVITACNGDMALRMFHTACPDIVVLDQMMPYKTGMQVLAEIRHESQVPVVLLTAVGDEESIVRALKSGADDYVVKPFRPRELKARIEALLRRSEAFAETRRPGPITCGAIWLDPAAKEVKVNGENVALTRTEFQLLEYLLLNQGCVVSISDALERVWGYEADQNEDTVRVTISRLRRKIEPDPAQPRYILNIPGQGYMIQDK